MVQELGLYNASFAFVFVCLSLGVTALSTIFQTCRDERDEAADSWVFSGIKVSCPRTKHVGGSIMHFKNVKKKTQYKLKRSYKWPLF